MSSNSSDSFDSDSTDEQSDESDNTPETSGSTIDDVLGGQQSNPTQGARDNDPEQYDIPHPLAREWMANRHSLRWSDETVPAYQSHTRIYLSYLREKRTTLLDARFVDLLEFVEYRVKVGAAHSTVKGNCSTLKDLYRYLQVRTDADPEIEPYEFDELSLSEYDYEGGFERGDIEPWEVKRLFRNFTHTRNRLMAYFAVATSVRNSDIRSLRLDDVNYDGLEIHISSPKNGDPYGVPMSRELASRLKQWEQTSREGYATAESSPYMFPSQEGERLIKNGSFNRMVVRAAERAGIQEVIGTATAINSRDLRDEQRREYHRVTVHALRHTCLTMLKKAGVPPEARRKLANHKDIETTENYTHDDDEDKRWQDLIRDLLDF